MKFAAHILRKIGIAPPKKTVTKETEEGIMYRIISDKETNRKFIRIDGLAADAETLKIPTKIEELEVEVIKKEAFAENKSLVSVFIPDGVRQIGAEAFRGCKALEKAELPKSLANISKACFEDCTSLKEIAVPDNLIKIYPNAFKGCEKLEFFAFPESLQTIGKNAFWGTKVKNAALEGYTQVFTVKEFCDIIGAEVPKALEKDKDRELVNSACHTRFVQKGGAFFAIHGKADDVRTAIEKGAKLIIVDRTFDDEENLLEEIPWVKVDDCYDAVGKIIAYIKAKVGFQVIGVTGSLGKTTTKELVYHVLKTKYRTARSLGNENTIYPLLNNIQRIPDDLEFFVQEYGMGVPGSLEKTVDVCVPDAGVITSISLPHIELYGSLENILSEKMALIKPMQEDAPVFLCYDNDLLRNTHLKPTRLWTYAMDEDADFQAENIEEKEGAVGFDVVYKGESTEVELNLFGKYNVNNALCAFAIGIWAGVPKEKIREGIREYCPSAKGFRQNFINIGGYHLYLDCYNSTPDSLISAAEVLGQLPLVEGGRRVAVLGEFYMLIKEDEQKIHEETAEKIKNLPIDIFVCFGGENARYMADEIKRDRQKNIEVVWTDNRKVLNQWLEQNITVKDTILFKGCNAAMLFKSVDQVFGSYFHRVGHFKEDKDLGNLKIRIVYENEEKDVDTATAAVLKYKGTDAEVKLPEEAFGIPLFGIGANAFDSNDKIERAVLSEPLVHLGDFSFARCKHLEEVTLPQTLKFIGRGAFRGCINLRRVEIPEGTTEIGEIAFKNCHSLEEVIIPSSVKRIGENAFLGCENVKFNIRSNSYAEKYCSE